MHFHIYNDAGQTALATEDGLVEHFGSEAAAIDAALRVADDNAALYSISYWLP